MRPITTAFVLLLAAAATAADDLPTASKVNLPRGRRTPADVAKAIKEQAGIEVDVSTLPDMAVAFDGGAYDFWPLVEGLADRAGGRITTVGGKVRVVAGKGAAPSQVVGPFRFVAGDVTIRGERGRPGNYALAVEMAWDPRLVVIRSDGYPKVDSLTDEAGKSFTVGGGGDRSFTSGIAKELTVRPIGVPRAAKSLNVGGSVRVTLADEMLAFAFDAIAPRESKQKDVTVRVNKSAAAGKDWVVVVEWDYPPHSAVWESYEIYWRRGNTCRLVPSNGMPVAADEVEHDDRSSRYVFKNRSPDDGWKIDYRTPGVMREVTVPFALKGIALP